MSELIRHLTVSAVKAIQHEVLAAHGGARGIRDEALLESAVAAPQATMMGKPLISDPVEIAAALVEVLFQRCHVDDEPVFHVALEPALVGLVDLVDLDQLGVRRHLVLVRRPLRCVVDPR